MKRAIILIPILLLLAILPTGCVDLSPPPPPTEPEESWDLVVSATIVSLSEAQPYKQVLVTIYASNLEPYESCNTSIVTTVDNPTLFGYQKTYLLPLDASPNGTIVQPQYIDTGYFGGPQDNNTQIITIMHIKLYVDGEEVLEKAINLQYDKTARAGVGGEYYTLIIHNPENVPYTISDAMSVWARDNETYAQYLLPAGVYTVNTPDGNLSVSLIGHGALVDLSLLTVEPVSEGMPITTSTVLFYVIAGIITGTVSYLFTVKFLKKKKVRKWIEGKKSAMRRKKK